MTGQQPEQDLNSPREECGVFGVWAPGEDVAKLTYYGLYALQHRGQEAAGIAVADGSQVLVFKDLGLVSQVFDEQTLAAMQGHVAIGHCRYSTTGDTTWENAQPVFRNTAAGTGVALGQRKSGQCRCPCRPRPRRGVDRHPLPSPGDDGLRHSGGAAGPRCCRFHPRTGGAGPAAHSAGAFCLTFMDENTLYACRDLRGAPAIARAFGPWLGGGLRNGRTRHRRRLVRP